MHGSDGMVIKSSSPVQRLFGNIKVILYDNKILATTKHNLLHSKHRFTESKVASIGD